MTMLHLSLGFKFSVIFLYFGVNVKIVSDIDIRRDIIIIFNLTHCSLQGLLCDLG